MHCYTLGLLGQLKNPYGTTRLRSPSILLCMLLGFWEYFEIPNTKERYFTLIGQKSWAKPCYKHGLFAIPY
jgi:hypothetical protein